MSLSASLPASHAETEAFVLRWQSPIYNLAFRMLRDPGGAEDVTCDIMRRALERLGQVDPDRNPKQWMYRLATNVILNHLRAAKTRRTREAEGASLATGAEDVMERRAAELAVQGEVRALPDSERTLLVLHFYSGLSKSEIAEVLNMPRTTVQSRMATALRSLRERLSRAGFAALTPMLESTLDLTPREDVPARLQKNLEHLIEVRSAAIGTTAGGLIVTKQLIGIGVALLLIGGGGGYWVRRLAVASSDVTETRDTAHVNTRGESSLVVGTPALAVNDQGATSSMPGPNGVSTHSDALTASAAGAPGAQDDPRTPTLDWSRFTEILGSHLKLFAKSQGDEAFVMTTDQRVKFLELIGEFMRIAELARGKSELPSTDAKIFPEFAVAFFDPVLAPGASARDALRTRAALELETTFATVDRLRTPPVKLRVLRWEVVDRIVAWVREGASEHNAGAMDQLARMRLAFMGGGDYHYFEVGVGMTPLEGERSAAERIVRVWRDSFALTEDQLSIAGEAAGRLVQAVEDDLHRRKLDHENAKVSGAIEVEITALVRRLQVEAEDQLALLLTEKQLAAARAHGPVLFDCYWGRGEEMNSGFGGL